MLDVVTIETPGLGDRSYVATDGTVAVVVDPQRDVDRVLAVVEVRGLRVTHVLETHVHNDYVSGGLALAERLGADYVVAGAEDVAFDRVPVGEGSRLEAGDLVIDVLRTPGHTTEHVAYVLGDGTAPRAVFTGGSMLYGTVGRTDLLGEDLAQELSRAQHRSVRRLAAQLPEHVAVHPTHGFGSFCSSTPGSHVDASTIGEERRTNAAVRTTDTDAFVRDLLAGLSAYPRYYAHMSPRNRRGADPIDLSPPPALDAAALRARPAAGDRNGWVVDLRDRRAFAAAHLPGTVNVEHDDPAATYLGWVLPWGTPVSLLAPDPAVVADAQRALARIGIDRPAGAAVLDPVRADGDLRRYPVEDFSALARRSDALVLDVRRAEEHAAGHVAGAHHVHFADVPARLDDLRARAGERPFWVHCASGYRASIAASLLDAAGIGVVLVDDEWGRAADAGVEVVRG